MINRPVNNCRVCKVSLSKGYTRSLKSWETATFCSVECKKGGYTPSESTLTKIREARLKQVAPHLGKFHTQETKIKMSGSHRLSFVKDPTLATRLSLVALGKRNSPATEFKKGLIPWNFGKQNPHSSGKNNSNWKGGVTKLQEKIRKSFKYRQWRSDVFQRDHYTCQDCSAKNGVGNGETILNADHIKPFALILQESLIDTFEKAMICEQLWNINNGRTLCIDCHKKTPTYLNNSAIKSILKI